MIIGENVHHQDPVAQLSRAEITRIREFVQGAVFCWCKNCSDKKGEGLWFTAEDLFGGLNDNWQGTPLQLLVDWHESDGDINPKLRAWKDLRYILMRMISDDGRRSYLTGRTDRGKRNYQWTGIDNFRPNTI